METQIDPNAGYELEVFFDGGCPLCSREINMLRRWDRDGRVRFTDIDAADFSAEGLGRTHEELMARLHGRLPDGTWLDGVEVFRRLYTAAGFRLLAGVSRWPGIAGLLDVAYRVFARHRLRLTGRCHAGQCRSKAV